MSTPRPFFGFGANTSSALITSLLGRLPKAQKATLYHHRVYIQPWKAIPRKAQRFLFEIGEWTPSFACYVLRPKRCELVEGVLWYLTHEEMECLQKWDLSNGQWTELSTVVCVTDDEQEVVAETHVLPCWHNDLLIPFTSTTFLNSRARMFKAGEKIRTISGLS
jgi:hypothetical protein